MLSYIQASVEKLERFKHSPFPIFSVYLGSPEAKTAPSSLMVSRFHSLLHRTVNKEDHRRFRADIQRIDQYLREAYDQRGSKSIALFTAGNHLFQTIALPFYLPSLIVIAYSPYVVPITEALRTDTSYLILLADHKKARFFIVHWGKIEEHHEVVNGQVPQRVKAKKTDYGRDDKIFRHIQIHLDRHLQLISEAAERFLEYHVVSFIIIGGHEELFGKLKKHFSPSLRKMVIGQFVIELDAPFDEVVGKSEYLLTNLYGAK